MAEYIAPPNPLDINEIIRWRELISTMASGTAGTTDSITGGDGSVVIPAESIDPTVGSDPNEVPTSCNTPDQAQGLIATPTANIVILEWDFPLTLATAIKNTIIYRGTVDDPDDPGTQQIAAVPYPMDIFNDNPPNPAVGATYYYWIKYQNYCDGLGAVNATAGTSATLPKDPTYMLEQLADSIGYGEFDVANGVFPVRVVSANPTLPDADYPIGSFIFNTTDGYMYKTEDGLNWVSVVQATEMEGEVDSTQIADGAVTTTKVNDLAITSTKIGNNSISSGKIQTNAITSDKIVSGSIVSAKIAAGAIIASHVGANEIIANSANLADAVVINAKIGDAAITEAKIGTAAVTNAKIGTAAITEAKIFDAAITTAKIQDAAITNAKVGTAAIDTANIATAAIETAKIADAAITTAKIDDAQVTTLKIGTDQVIVPASSHISSSGSLSGSYASVVSVSITIPSGVTNQNVLIDWSVGVTGAPDTTSGEVWNGVDVKLSRGATTLTETTALTNGNPGNHLLAATYAHAASAGTFTYYLYMKEQDSNDTTTVYDRTIRVALTKR